MSVGATLSRTAAGCTAVVNMIDAGGDIRLRHGRKIAKLTSSNTSLGTGTSGYICLYAFPLVGDRTRLEISFSLFGS
jgi:hypothetical protein